MKVKWKNYEKKEGNYTNPERRITTSVPDRRKVFYRNVYKKIIIHNSEKVSSSTDIYISCISVLEVLFVCFCWNPKNKKSLCGSPIGRAEQSNSFFRGEELLAEVFFTSHMESRLYFTLLAVWCNEPVLYLV